MESSMSKKIYLDNASTTQIDPSVARVMIDSYKQFDPSGKGIEDRVEKRFLRFLGVETGCLLFTSGGTEANNVAIRSLIEEKAHLGNRILVSCIEHPSVGNVMKTLASEGYDVVEIPVDETGVIDLNAFKERFTSDTILVSVMYFNNEIGTKQPIEAIEAFLQDKSASFHVDAIQALGKTDLQAVGDAMTFSAHKIYGPKGVGAIYYKKPDMKSGLCNCVKNIEGIIGFEKAIDLLEIDLPDQIEKMKKLKNDLKSGLMGLGHGLKIVGNQESSHPGILNVFFPNRDGDALVIRYDMEGICISSGSACSSGALSASHVLLAMGMDSKDAKKCVRFSIGRNTTESDIDKVLEATKRILRG